MFSGQVPIEPSRQDSNHISSAPSMENKLSSATVLPPFLRLPPEIRLKIYRLLLLSEASIRMQFPFPDGYDMRYPPNSLFPAILCTCHLIYGEAMVVLYKENVFRAHRVTDSNENAALITRAKFVIGANDSGVVDALGLARFLDTHPNLKLLKLQFHNGYLENGHALKIVSEALVGSGYSSALSVFSDVESPASYLNEAQLLQAVAQNASRK